MGFKLRRRLFSQNFLCNPKLIAKLIRNSSVGKKDLVLEIGSGKGYITEKLLEASDRVIAVEVDSKLCLHLNSKFSGTRNLEVVNQNFLDFYLPKNPFKVFSNIPFNKTADIIRKLTSNPSFSEGYLIVQKEAAKRFIGKPYDAKNSMQAMLLKPWFSFGVVYEFNRCDFVPKPNVDVVMINISRRVQLTYPWTSPLIQRLYKDYVVYRYNRSKVSRMDFEKFSKQFENYLKHTSVKEKEIVSANANKIYHEQGKILKINRTRNDKNWRKFK